MELINSSTAERNQFEFSAPGFEGIISPNEFVMPVTINTFKALLIFGAGALQERPLCPSRDWE